MKSSRLSDERSLFFKLVRIVNLTARPFQERVGAEFGLTLNEWRAMVVLAAHPGCTATDVARHTGLDRMPVSRALSGLEKSGRLTRKVNPRDQRESHLSLSAQGMDVFAQAGPRGLAREHELYAGLSAAERRQLDAMLDRLIQTLQPEDAPP